MVAHAEPDERLLDLMSDIGAQLGRVFERTQGQKRLQRNIEQLTTLREIDRAIMSTLELTTVVDLLLKKIDAIYPDSAATVSLLNKDKDSLEPVASRNFEPEAWKSMDWSGRLRVPRNVAAGAEIWKLESTQFELDGKDVAWLQRRGWTSYLRVPMMSKNEALGVLGFYTKAGNALTDDDVEFVITLGGQAAIAIHNSLLYEQLGNITAELEKSNKVKDEFLSVISHELRTPLNIILGFAATVKDRLLGDINGDQERALEKVMRQAREELSMVNSILDMSQLEAKTMRIEKYDVRMERLLEELRAEYAYFQSEAVSVTWDYPPDVFAMKTDGAKLKHVLKNLINNALKFTEKGAVKISARIDRDGRFLILEVADTGIGIAPECLPDMFQRFHQLDSSDNRSYGGLGVGLYIVKQFAEMLGGTVDVSSRLGVGSTFVVQIPYERGS